MEQLKCHALQRSLLHHIMEDGIYYSLTTFINCHSDKLKALTNYRFTSGSCCRSSASITGGAFPISHNSLYIETSSPIPSSKKDGEMTLFKDVWVYGIKCY